MKVRFVLSMIVILLSSTALASEPEVGEKPEASYELKVQINGVP